MIKIFIIGHHGMGNLGDDLMLIPIVNNINDIYINFHLKISAGEKLPVLIDQSYRVNRSILNIFINMFWSDNIIVAGGTHMHYQERGLRFIKDIFFQYSLFSLAKFFNKKVYMLGVGLGPFSTRLTSSLASKAVSKCNKIEVRDSISYRWIKEVANYEGSLTLSEDPAIKYLSILNIGKSNKISGTLGINGFCFFESFKRVPKEDQIIARTISKYLHNLINKNIVKNIRFFVFCSKPGRDSDSKFGIILKKLLPKKHFELVNYSRNTSDFLYTLSECSLFISFRYHSMVAAHVLEIPQIGICYHQKNLAYAKEVGLFPNSTIMIDDLLKKRKLPNKFSVGS